MIDYVTMSARSRDTPASLSNFRGYIEKAQRRSLQRKLLKNKERCDDPEEAIDPSSVPSTPTPKFRVKWTRKKAKADKLLSENGPTPELAARASKVTTEASSRQIPCTASSYPTNSPTRSRRRASQGQ